MKKNKLIVQGNEYEENEDDLTYMRSKITVQGIRYLEKHHVRQNFP